MSVDNLISSLWNDKYSPAGQALEFPPDKDEISVTGERRQYSSVYTTSSGSDSVISRHHSYETLNMSDTGGDVATASTPLATGHQQTSTTLPRLPHRPAPPIPSLLPKMLMTAKEREYLQQVGFNFGR